MGHNRVMPDPRDAQRTATLLEFPDAHPYQKWWGSHWRLVALADLGAQPPPSALDKGVGQVLGRLVGEHREVRRLRNGVPLRHASQEGNAVYACVRLGVDDDRVERLVETLLESQWPDGGWNCSPNASGRRSSLHESVTPAIGLAVYDAERDDEVALAATAGQASRSAPASRASASSMSSVSLQNAHRTRCRPAPAASGSS